MPSVASKEQAPEEEPDRRNAERLIRMIGPLVFLFIGSAQMITQARPALVGDLCGGDQAKTAEMLAAFGGLGGAAAFLFNPVMGRASDRFGRRPVMLASPFACGLLRGIVAAFPRSPPAILAERVLSQAMLSGFFSTMRAMLNDRLTQKESIVAGGVISSCAGAGLVLGPYLEVVALATLGPRGAFAIGAGAHALVGTLVWKYLGETLPVSERKPLTVKDCSPLTFVEMARIGAPNRAMMLILLLQSFGEGWVTQEINQLNLRDNLGWTPVEISSYLSLAGASVAAGGMTVKHSIERLGLSGHTTFSHLAMAAGFYFKGMRTKYASQFLFLALSFAGGRKRDAVDATCSDITLANSDMGRGQVSAALTNLKAIANVLGPYILGRAYAYGHSFGNTGLPFRVIAILYILAEVVHQSLGRKLEALGGGGQEKRPPSATTAGGGRPSAELN